MSLRSPASGNHPIRKILTASLIASAVVLFFGVSPAGAQSSDEANSLALVNSARAAEGLGSLASNSGLNAIARAQAARMAQRDAIFHNPNLKADADAAGVNWLFIGENVGVGPNVQAVHEAFMASPGHRENVVFAQYNALGVGVVVGGDGSVFVAHAFAHVMTESAPAPAPAAPSATAPAASAPSAPAPVVEAATVPVQSSPANTVPVNAPAPIVVMGGVVNMDSVFEGAA